MPPEEVKLQDSSQEQETSTALPVVPKVSDASGAQPSSAGGTPPLPFDEEALIEKVASRLEGLIDRKFQSTKDRRFADVERLTQYLKANSNDPAKAMREMQIDDLLNQREGATASRPVPGKDDDGEQQARLVKQATEILGEAGIAFDDQGVKQWSEATYVSESAAITALSKMVSKRLKQANAGQGRPVFDGQTQTPPGASDKQKQLDAIDAELPGLYKDYSQNREKISGLKKKRAELAGA